MTLGQAAPPGCANCDTLLAGAWCHACGQHALGNHRSLRHLGLEFAEIVTHADSRLWRTVRLLAVRPARLTNDYLAGRRVSQIPPLRLLLVVLFVLFGLGLANTDVGHQLTLPGEQDKAMIATLHDKIAHLSIGDHTRATSWLRSRLSRALDNPHAFISITSEWAERFALLLLPVGALLMAMLAIGRAGFTLFDHFIFVMHSMSATATVMIAGELLSRIGLDGVSPTLMFIPPVHLFFHMKGVYGFGASGTLLRMAVLGVGSSIAILVLVIALAGFGLYTIPG